MSGGREDHVEVRSGAYRDSVTLMRASRMLAERPGVCVALAAMATPPNLELLAGMGFAPPEAGPDDLVVAIRAEDAAALRAARTAVDDLLAPTPPGTETAPAARTAGSAARRIDATLALVSVPGPYAFAEAMDALDAGLNVMIFSDNVPPEHELVLKETAARRGLLVMGPDCGTAVIGGVGLGFANAVRPGKVGLVAASGTGAQQLMSLLDEAGAGISHALGVGGRDLSARISGRSSLQALRALDTDPATELIVVVSKPPAPEVGDLIRAAARRLTTPVLFALAGEVDLTTAAEKALTSLGLPVPAWPSWSPPDRPAPRTGVLRGMFAGGTLCAEAALIADGVPHVMTDFGDDRYTRGRAHPIIDPTLRLERLAAEGPEHAVTLIDVVLGYGAEPDPAAALAPVIERSPAPVVVSLCGTAADPQGRDRQAERLAAAGATVFTSNAAAARHAVALAGGS